MRVFIFYFSMIILVGSFWEKEKVFAGTKNSFVNINHSTERYRRTQLLCKIATQPNLKPFPSGLDDFRTNFEMNTYADLYGDGSIEFVAGVSDSTFLLKNEYFPYLGNKKRATGPTQHAVYSPKPNFQLDVSLSFHNAHFFTVDINKDGADDIIFVQQGRDFAPFERKQNYILISSNGSYELQTLPGARSPYHNGTAGDIDNDGDIDVIVVPGFENKIIAYINNGNSIFEYREIAHTAHGSWDDQPRYYTAGLWDFDEDGYLDLILGSQKDYTKIFWGDGSGSYTRGSIEVGDRNDYFFDFEFFDTDNDGTKELVTFGGSFNDQSDHQNHYKGWHIQKIDLQDREVVAVETLEKVITESNFFLEKFSACDIQNDGDLDLVYERHSQFYRTRKFHDEDLNFSTITRLIWFNNLGKFKRVRIEDPNYYRSYHTAKRSAVIEHAKRLGTTAERYIPKQIYYPFDGKGTYVHAYPPNFATPYLDDPNK